MYMNLRSLFIGIVLFFFGIYNLYSQETTAAIPEIIFNNTSTYAPGSGVSVHIDPKGVYEIADIDNDEKITQLDLLDDSNNRFILYSSKFLPCKLSLSLYRDKKLYSIL